MDYFPVCRQTGSYPETGFWEVGRTLNGMLLRLALMGCAPRLLAGAGATNRRLPAYAHVLESHGAQAGRIEQVFGVDNDGAFQQVADLVEV